MTSGGLKRLAEFLWRSSVPAEWAGASDGELLARLAERGDREAFAALVDRHGSLVWGVCGRMLNRTDDCEDAFQATFLVLARRAAAIRQRDSVRSWLYGVAVRVATRARSDGIRRRVGTEAETDEPLQSGLNPEQYAQLRELRKAIDEAVAELPDRQRLAILLAYFEGRTHDESAKLLGCPRGTIATLLARARESLRRRLIRRGLAPSVSGLICLTLDGISPATTPDFLAASTVGAASAIRLGLAAGAAAPTAAGLVEGVMRSMFLANLKLPALALSVVLAAGVGVGVWLQPRAEGQPAPGGGAERPAAPTTPSKSELEQLKEQVRLAEAVLQSARKRLNELEGGPPTGNTPSGIGANSTNPFGAATTPPMSNTPRTTTPRFGPGGGMGVGEPPAMTSGASVDRLRRIEQLTEELRKEVEALRRESRPTTPSATTGPSR